MYKDSHKFGPVLFSNCHRDRGEFVIQTVDECPSIITRIVGDLGEVLYTNPCEFVYITGDYVSENNHRRDDLCNFVELLAELLRRNGCGVHDT